jgi:hypothetical protein
MSIMIKAAILLQKKIGNDATLQLMKYRRELYILCDLYYSKNSTLRYFSDCPCITFCLRPLPFRYPHSWNCIRRLSLSFSNCNCCHSIKLYNKNFQKQKRIMEKNSLSLLSRADHALRLAGFVSGRSVPQALHNPITSSKGLLQFTQMPYRCWIAAVDMS